MTLPCSDGMQSNAITVTLGTKAGSAPLVYQVHFTNRALTVSPVDVSTPAGQSTLSTNLLANPQIRVRNKEKAKIHIGDRVPVLTTTAAAAGTFVSQSVTYLDVGLKLEVEPLVYLDDDVGIKLSLEVSSITNTIQTPSGSPMTVQQIRYASAIHNALSHQPTSKKYTARTRNGRCAAPSGS